MENVYMKQAEDKQAMHILFYPLMQEDKGG